MPMLSGTKYVVPVIQNHLAFSSSMNKFFYSIDLSSLLLDPQIAYNISSVNNVGVYHFDTDSVCKKMVYYSSALGKLCIDWVGELSHTVNQTFYICFGITLNSVNDSSIYSCVNATNVINAEDYDNVPTDKANPSNILNLKAPASYNNNGKIGRCFSFSGSGGGIASNVLMTEISLIYPFSIELFYKPNVGTPEPKAILSTFPSTAQSDGISPNIHGTNMFYVTTYRDHGPLPIISNNWNYIAFTVSSSMLLNMIVNSGEFNATFDSHSYHRPWSIGNHLYLDYPANGFIDSVIFYNGVTIQNSYLKARRDLHTNSNSLSVLQKIDWDTIVAKLRIHGTNQRVVLVGESSRITFLGR